MPIDWLFYGDLALRVWDFAASRRAPFAKDDFVRAYSGGLSKQIDLIRSIDGNSDSELRGGVGVTLQNISVVVRNYHPKGDELKINANYMIPIPPNRRLIDRAKFCDKGLREDAFSCMLSLQRWAYPVNGLPKEMLIPVAREDQTREAVLFGAPWAYLNNDMYVVNNTLRIRRHLPKAVHPDLRDDIEKYFKGHKQRLRSFMSVPVPRPPGVTRQVGCAEHVVAVLNVQSNAKAVAGVSRATQRKMQIALIPLVTVLAHYIVRLHDAPGGPRLPPAQGQLAAAAALVELPAATADSEAEQDDADTRMNGRDDGLPEEE